MLTVLVTIRHKEQQLPVSKLGSSQLSYLCSLSEMSLLISAVVTCCSISKTSSHPVRICVARDKMLVLSS